MPLFSRWRRLSSAEQGVVLEALLLLPCAKLAVRTIRVDRLVRVRPGSDQGQTGVRTGSDPGLTPFMGRLRVGRKCNMTGARVALIVSRVAFHARLFTCLDAAVAAWWVMRRRGWAPVLCLGTAVDADRFAAHAWLELDGRPLTPPSGHLTIWRSR